MVTKHKNYTAYDQTMEELEETFKRSDRNKIISKTDRNKIFNSNHRVYTVKICRMNDRTKFRR